MVELVTRSQGPGMPSHVTLPMEVVAQRTIKEPVAYIDFELPERFSSYILKLSNTSMSSDSYDMALAVSQDNGETFVCDPPNIDTYFWVRTLIQNIGTNDKYLYDNFYQAGDSLGYIGAPVTSPSINCNIMPGSDVVPFAIETYFTGFTWPGTGHDFIDGDIELGRYLIGPNPNSETPFLLKRINLIRVLPYGNGDCDPPTSGRNILTGSYVLYGIP